MAFTQGAPLQTISTLAELVAAAQALLAAHGDMRLRVSMTEAMYDDTRYVDAKVIYEPCVTYSACVLMVEA
jgi:hypothetical protein